MPVVSKIDLIKTYIASFPDFPKPGILFRDVCAVLREPKVAAVLYDLMCSEAKSFVTPVDCVAGLDARGFLFGVIISKELGIPFIPIRKKGKLPGITTSVHYELEYNKGELEVQNDSIKKGQKVLIVDDLIATGGTLAASVELIAKLGGEAVCLVAIELTNLEGRKLVNVPVHSIIKY